MAASIESKVESKKRQNRSGVKRFRSVSTTNTENSPVGKRGAASGLEDVEILLVASEESEFLWARALVENLNSRSPMPMGWAPRFSLQWCATFDAGLERLRACEGDVCLVGTQIETKTGAEFLQTAGPEDCEIPILLLADEVSPALVSAMSAGAADFLFKDETDAAALERAIRYGLAQKTKEKQLREVTRQNALFFSALENASIGIVVSCREGEKHPLVYANRAFELLTGFKRDEVIGREIGFLGDAIACPAEIEAFNAAIGEGRAFETLVPIERAESQNGWSQWSISPLLDAQHQVVGHVGLFRDVTANMEALRELKEARFSLETTQKLTHLGSWKIVCHDAQSLDFTVEFLSSEMYRILGWEPNAIPPSREMWMNAIHPDDRSRVEEEMRRAFASDEHYECEYRVVCPGGETRNLVARAQIQRSYSSCPIYVQGTALDVTALKKAEEAEKSSQTQLLAVLNSVPIVLWATDKNGVFTLSEGSTLEKIGLKPGEVVGQSLFELYGEFPRVLEMTRAALEGIPSHEQVEVAGVVFDSYSLPYRNDEGEILGTVGVSQDVTEMARIQRELIESQSRWARMLPNLPGVLFCFEMPSQKDLPARFVFISEGCQEIYGVSASDAVEQPDLLFSLVVYSSREKLLSEMRISARDLTPWQTEFEIERPDGERRWLRSQSRPRRRPNGDIVWDGITVDVTSTLRAQEEISASRLAVDEAQRLSHVGSFRWKIRTGQVHWSDETYRIFGESRESFIPTYDSIFQRIHPDDAARVAAQSEVSIATVRPSHHTFRILRSDGSVRIVELHTRIECDDEGEIVELLGSVQDVTEREEAQVALRESEERYALAALGSNDGLWDWNLQTNQIYFSPRWKAMIGFGDDEISSDVDEWLRRVHPEDLERLQGEIQAHLTMLSRGTNEITAEIPHTQFQSEYRLKSRDGSYRWMLARGASLRDAQGRPARFAGSQTDITEQRSAQALLERNAFYDSLTELPNRALFLNRLEHTLARSARPNSNKFAVLSLDLDRFKKINDSLGHQSGDRLLIEAARRFESCLRPCDTVARLGGDEFAVLLCDITDDDNVTHVAERIQQELHKPYLLDGREIFLTVSIGIVSDNMHDLRADELLRNAETAMYRAKSEGRSRSEHFDTSMHQRAMRMLELESDLWRAIERGELRLFYQPIIGLTDGKIVGSEALVRWEHPVRGLVSPGDFIPLAEETGLIVPIGWWVLREACIQARRWNENSENPVYVAVNFSSKQFSQPDVVSCVQQILEETGVSPSHIKLEITESVLVENTESALVTLAELKKVGLELSLDDFGTGYSSLSYLHRFPLDILKIDRSFVSQMASGSKNSQIVTTIVALGQALSMKVVAEGVETVQQLQVLRNLGCQLAQGYHFSRPLPLPEIEELLKRDLKW